MAETAPASVYDFSAPSLTGDEVPMTRFHGSVLLFVNTASKCVFTPQYAGLEELYRRFHPSGFEVLGFPCNQFGAQEPGTEEEIGQFCSRNYGVSFPMFAKIDVNGPDTHPLFAFLKKTRGGFFGTGGIKWNFTKFLADREGRVVARFAPGKSPRALASAVEKLL